MGGGILRPWPGDEKIIYGHRDDSCSVELTSYVYVVKNITLGADRK